MDEINQEQIQVNNQDDVYVFIKFLGHGSFGKVNLYRNTTDNSLVVWKEIDLKKLETKMRNEAFAEVEILSMLDHANIISYYKHFLCNETLYIELQYAKGGTLANLIKQKKTSSINDYFDQDTVLWYLYQLTSAVDYIHDMGIMHRDLKALNIFLMQTGLLKLGDFGIAKVLDPNNNNLLESLVGTPFYMSPEIVEGKKYSYKSDIWALGCVAYEIMTLSKVFDATNQLKLAIKISCCDIDEIKCDYYSDDLKNLIKKILSKEPTVRPSAKEILLNSIFAHKTVEFNSRIEQFDLSSKKSRSFLNQAQVSPTTVSTPIVASKLSEVYIWGGGTRLPKQIETFKKETAPLQVSIGSSHYAVLTVEKELYTWSITQGGQSNSSTNAKLGHGKQFGNTRIPKRVDKLNGILIDQVCCGDEFTCCLCENGDLYTFGSNMYGCLAHGQEVDLCYEPTKVKYFEENNLKVKSVSCGDSHVLALTHDNRVFTWGCGEYGRLGHDDEDDRYEPTEIQFSFKYKFKNVYAGSDYSFLLTKEGRVLAFGNNEYNKLCLNDLNSIGLFKKSIQAEKLITHQLKPKLVNQLLTYKIDKICPGQNHTAVIDYFGRLFTFGCNKNGQLGVGDTKPRSGLNLISGTLAGHFVTNSTCGDSFTLCSTSENHLFSWGNRKDGRLGLDSNFDDNSSICLPKPIFGSLHLVSDLCSKNWSTIIIAERELNTIQMRRTINSNQIQINEQNNQVEENESLGYGSGLINSNDSNNLTDLGGHYGLNENIVDFNLNADNYSTSVSDDAYKNKRYDEIMIMNDDENEASEMPEWLKKDLEEAEFIPIEALNRSEPIKNLDDAFKLIKELREENLKLKEENEKVK